MIKFATIVGGLVFGLGFLAIWALAYYFSAWWWLLLIGFVPAFLIALFLRLFVGFLAAKIYPKPLSKSQKKLVNNFADKLQRLAEARGMGWPVFAFLSLKDLIFHRDLRTAKSTIYDTASLRKDFVELEELLK